MTERIRWEVRDWIAQYPQPYLGITRLTHPRFGDSEPVRSDTEVVIEGFPRSGNTFAVAAFRMTQAEPVRIAHHLHAPAQVIQAVRRGIPAMVLVREPEPAVISLVIRDPRVSVDVGLRQYIRFHRRLLAWREDFLVVRFETVVSDFGRAIREVNARCGASFFSEFDNSEAGLHRYRAAVEAAERRKYRGSRRLEDVIAVPSEARDGPRREVTRALEDSKRQGAREAARDLYDAYLESAV